MVGSFTSAMVGVLYTREISKHYKSGTFFFIKANNVGFARNRK